MLVSKAKGLTVTTSWQFVANRTYHRRHNVKLIPKYKNRGKDWSLPRYITPGKTLRNKKHHVPKYKYIRAGLSDVNFSYIKSANQNWDSARLIWIKNNREIKKLHIAHMENNLQPHWWKV